MPKFHVEESILIDKPVSEVYEFVKNDDYSRSWDPWLVCDPEAESKYEGGTYHWKGEYVGEGEMVLDKEEKNKSLEYNLEFRVPYKSKAKVWYEFKKKKNGTEVSWYMDGSLPFFMFWLKNTMKAMIGMDYQRGLRMLKDLVENGEIVAKSTYEGIVDMQVPYLVGYKSSCSLSEVGDDMGKTFGKLMKRSQELGWKPSGSPLALYTKYDMVKKHCEYYAVMQLDDVKDVDDAEFEIIDFESGKAMHGKHMGDYKHLGNLWSMLMMRAMKDKIKLRKGVVGLEVYNTMPGQVEVKDYDTDIYLMLR